MGASKKPPPPEPRRPSAPSREPIRRSTIEVDVSWLEEIKPSKPPPKRRETIEVQAEWLEVLESDSKPPAKSKPAPKPAPQPAAKRRGPPSLPKQPKVEVARGRRAIPPPLPREEPEDDPPRRSRPPKR